jgi:hypothetical protein
MRSPRLETYTKKGTFAGQSGLLTGLGEEARDDPWDHAERAGMESGVNGLETMERKRKETERQAEERVFRLFHFIPTDCTANVPAALERCLSPGPCNTSTTLDS